MDKLKRVLSGNDDTPNEENRGIMGDVCDDVFFLFFLLHSMECCLCYRITSAQCAQCAQCASQLVIHKSIVISSGWLKSDYA